MAKFAKIGLSDGLYSISHCPKDIKHFFCVLVGQAVLDV